MTALLVQQRLFDDPSEFFYFCDILRHLGHCLGDLQLSKSLLHTVSEGSTNTWGVARLERCWRSAHLSTLEIGRKSRKFFSEKFAAPSNSQFSNRLKAVTVIEIAVGNLQEQAMSTFQRLTPCLWFDNQAEEAAKFYTGIFKNSKIRAISRYPAVGQEIHGREAGSVMTVEFELDGHSFTALNGGPVFKFNEAISLQVNCKDQAEVDYYWERFGAGGDPKAQQCGWLKDKYGVSWQIVPEGMAEIMSGSRPDGTERAFKAMLTMKKLDIAELKRAYEG